MAESPTMKRSVATAPIIVGTGTNAPDTAMEGTRNAIAEAACVRSQGPKQSNHVALLRHRQSTHRLLEQIGVRGKHLLDQRPAVRRQLAEHHARILAACPPSHQPALFELLDDIRRARASEENAIADLAEPQRSLVMQHLQDGKLGQAQPVLNQMRSDNLLERLKRAA